MKIFYFWLNQLCSMAGCKLLAKSAITLAGCFFLTIQVAGPTMYSADIKTQSMIYTVEDTYKKPLEEIDCDSIPKQVVECLTAKHADELRGVSVDLAMVISDIFLLLAMLSTALCILSFCAIPYFQNETV